MKLDVTVLKFSVLSSPAGDVLTGTEVLPEGRSGCPFNLYLGEEPITGTLTSALRGFSLPTARAPGDWPSTDGTAVRY